MSGQCGACKSNAVTRISITMAGGEVVDFTSCHRCEHKSYALGDEAIDLAGVKELAGRKK